jgi:hypothetical protein
MVFLEFSDVHSARPNSELATFTFLRKMMGHFNRDRVL